MDDLIKYIADYRKRVASLEDELKVARTKLDGMEEMYVALQQKNKAELSFVTLDAHTVEPPMQQSPLLARPTNKRRRPLSPQWSALLSVVNVKGAATLDEIDKIDPKIERKLLRSQLGYYTKQGWLTKNESTGAYSLTEYGLDACGFQKGESHA
jgi:hypothetical protein